MLVKIPAKLARCQTGPLPHHPVLGRPGDLVQRSEEPVLGRTLKVPLLADRAVVLQKRAHSLSLVKFGEPGIGFKSHFAKFLYNLVANPSQIRLCISNQTNSTYEQTTLYPVKTHEMALYFKFIFAIQW